MKFCSTCISYWSWIKLLFVSLNKLVVSYNQGFPYNKIISIFEFLGRIVPSCFVRLQKHSERGVPVLVKIKNNRCIDLNIILNKQN